ncbi:MAG: hypothetical protein GXY74_11620 [Phycisphaerae bacterium]|nr:hypothetical protein [Phycisphaerae bacterium]
MARPIGRQQALDQLGDLFFGATGARPPTPLEPPDGFAAAGPPPQNRTPSPGVDDLLARPLDIPHNDVRADVAPACPATVAILTGGVPPQRRLLLAREAVARLMAPCGLTALVTFDGPRATVAALARDDVQVAASEACGHFGDVIRAADRVILVLADAAGEFIASGGSLPDHCVVLTLADPQWLVEAYRELKAATTATKGPVPDVFVLEADARDEAERTFRRLSRVAIAHLGCSPTFVGHTVGRGGTAAPVPVRCVFDSLDARAVYGCLQPLLRVRGGDATGPDRSAAPPAARPQEIQSVTVRPAEPQAGRRQTLPPVAGVVDMERGGTGAAAFAAWRPASRDELLEAVAASLANVVPGLRGTIDVRADLGADAEGPDLVAVDRDGAAVAVLVAEDGNPAALVRAGRCRRWLAAHVRLLRRAYGDAGLAAGDRPVGCVVLAADEQAATLRGLRPQDVRLVTYLPLRCGAVHGLLLRESTDTADTVIGTVSERESASVASALGAAPPSPERSAAASTAGASASVPHDEPPRAAVAPADLEPSDARGTSPDDDLSADELSDLRNGFEIDELT